MTTTKKYMSPSTVSVSHDLTNFIVEAILINRCGALPEAAWRKGGSFAKEWGKLLKVVRRLIKTLEIAPEQLAWYVQFYKATNLNYDEFGLLRWKVQHYFKWCNVDKFTGYYTELHKSLDAQKSNYIEQTIGYKVKEPTTSQRKKLSDILKELEDGENRID